MSTATLSRLPNTVTACHVMIRLISRLNAEIEEKNDEIEDLRAQISASEGRYDELEKTIEGNADPIDAIDQFLYEVERPVGQLKFDVIHGDAADRAILRLFDAVGRNP